jgi:hypothetical protein
MQHHFFYNLFAVFAILVCLISGATIPLPKSKHTSTVNLNLLVTDSVILTPTTTSRISPCTDATSTVTEVFDILRDSSGTATTTNIYPVTRSLNINNSVTLHVQVGCANGIQVNSIVYDKQYPTSSALDIPSPTTGPLQSAYPSTSASFNQSWGKCP